jgi:hypothetical protein
VPEEYDSSGREKILSRALHRVSTRMGFTSSDRCPLL